jgi:hypothetical protein
MRRRQPVRNEKTFPTVVGDPSTMWKPSRPSSAACPQCGNLSDRRRQPVNIVKIFPTVVGSLLTLWKPSRPSSATRPQCESLPDRRRQPVNIEKTFSTVVGNPSALWKYFWFFFFVFYGKASIRKDLPVLAYDTSFRTRKTFLGLTQIAAYEELISTDSAGYFFENWFVYYRFFHFKRDMFVSKFIINQFDLIIILHFSVEK